MSEAGLIGRMLGDFRIREVVGAGGGGTVYLAEQPLLNREAIIKVPRHSVAISTEAIDTFLKEARLASKLDHPYSAHVYAFGTEGDGILWTAMELVRGTPLGEIISQQGPMPLARFVPLFDKLCEVVHTAHEQGIVHRDLKPSNVMVISRAGRQLPKLLDLGVAKLGTDVAASSSGGVTGSPAYMAPEQWMDARKADAQSDVYSLGALAYQCLTGRLPFAAKSIREMAFAHAREPVPSLGAEASPEMDAWIKKAMAKSKADRFGSALELGNALRTASGILAEPIKLPEIDPFLRDRWMAEAPAPLAEAVAALDGVRHAHQAQHAISQLVRALVRWTGNLALAAWAQRSHAAPATDGEIAISEKLGQLRQFGLGDADWIALARLIAGEHKAHRDAFLLPDLVEAFFPATSDAAAFDQALALLCGLRSRQEELLAMPEAGLAQLLGQAVAALETALRSFDFLCNYAVLVPKDALGERWMGARKQHRGMLAITGGLPAAGQPQLADASGAIVFPLYPLVQVTVPAPGYPAEMFALEGSHRGSAKLLSLPTGFEHADHAVWPWLSARTPIAYDVSEQGTSEKPPFRGLLAFTRDDADVFVGRERESETFANRLRITTMLAVVGPSGAGKSSFIQAGVMPSLGPHWTSLIVRPGGAPLTALASMLRKEGVTAADADEATLLGSGLANALTTWAKRNKRSILLYIDQFEELFTLCHDREVRNQYVDALIRAAGSPDEPLRVVLTVRDDFLLRCQEVVALRDQLAQGLQLLATPTPDDLLRILVEPSRRAGYEFEDEALPREMVEAVTSMQSALPLLSFTAAQLWDLRDKQSRRLSRKAYESLGGVGGALAQHAERVLSDMTPDEQKLVRIAFRNLVTADGTRAILTKQELLELLGSSAETVLEKLIHARLLTASEGAGGADRVEVVHEALLSAWPRLLHWRREDAEGARLRDQLRAAARQWDARGRQRGMLWRDDALTEYQLWRTRNPDPLTSVEQAFADASLKEAARGRRLRNIAVGTIFTSLTVGMAVALVLYRDAETQRKKARDTVLEGHVTAGQNAARKGDMNSAMVYLTAAKAGGKSGVSVDMPLGAARNVMTVNRTYRNHEKKVWSLGYSAAHRRFVTGGADGGLNIWDPDRSEPVHHIKEATDGIYTLSISNDGQRVAVPSEDGSMRVYDIGSGQRLGEWQVAEGETKAAFFVGDDIVAGNSSLGKVSVYRISTQLMLGSIDTQGQRIGIGAVNPAGTVFAVPYDNGALEFWDLKTFQRKQKIPNAHAAPVWKASYSPDGKMLATAGWDSVAKLWDAESGRLLATLVGHTAMVDEVLWSPDGSQLATTSRDGTVRIWQRDGAAKVVLDSKRGLVYGARWTQDGNILVTSGDSAMLWDINIGLPIARHSGQGAAIFQAMELPGTNDVISIGSDGTAHRWSAASKQAAIFLGHDQVIYRLHACPDAWLSVGSDARAKTWSETGQQLWSSPKEWEVTDADCLASGDLLVTLRDGRVFRRDKKGALLEWSLPVRLGEEPLILASPSGKKIATVDKQGVLVILNADGTFLAKGHAPDVSTGWESILNWSADEAALVLETSTKATVWDATTGENRFVLDGPGGTVRRTVVDASGESFFLVGEDYSVRRISLRDGRELTRYTNDAFAWSAVPMGNRLYVGLDDGYVVEFDIDSGQRTNVVGYFGGDVFTLSAAGDGLLWVGAGDQSISLLDAKRSAVLSSLRSPGDLFVSTPGGDLRGGFATFSGGIALLHLRIDDTPLPRLYQELACRVPFELAGGALRPRAIDPSACRGLDGETGP